MTVFRECLFESIDITLRHVCSKKLIFFRQLKGKEEKIVRLHTSSGRDFNFSIDDGKMSINIWLYIS